MMNMSRLVLAAVAAISFTACGSDSPSSAPSGLSPEGERGRQIARPSGCSSCHGVDGEGQLGPPFVGLYGSTVTFDDGTTAIADEAYLRQSIREPAAKRVAGYQLPMPQSNLSDEEVELLIAYIRDLSTPASTATTAP
jgi:cytochrome c oxidase subunit 2